jgi:hypothetical protein
MNPAPTTATRLPPREGGSLHPRGVLDRAQDVHTGPGGTRPASLPEAQVHIQGREVLVEGRVVHRAEQHALAERWPVLRWPRLVPDQRDRAGESLAPKLFDGLESAHARVYRHDP